MGKVKSCSGHRHVWLQGEMTGVRRGDIQPGIRRGRTKEGDEQSRMRNVR